MADIAGFRVPNAPIVEAIVDFRCDLSPALQRGVFQSNAQKAFADKYPEFRTAFFQESQIAVAPGKQPKGFVRQGVRGFQSHSRDKKQIIQSRFDGFSFNRLAPYSSLDDYLPEIQRCWEIYRDFANPVVIKRVALRFINRVHVPLKEGRTDLDLFLRVGPMVPADQLKLSLGGFTHNNQFVEPATGNVANVVIATQKPIEADGATKLILILDIDVFKGVNFPPADWSAIAQVIASLRVLKNEIFQYTLTKECLSSQPPSP